MTTIPFLGVLNVMLHTGLTGYTNKSGSSSWSFQAGNPWPIATYRRLGNGASFNSLFNGGIIDVFSVPSFGKVAVDENSWGDTAFGSQNANAAVSWWDGIMSGFARSVAGAGNRTAWYFSFAMPLGVNSAFPAYDAETETPVFNDTTNPGSLFQVAWNGTNSFFDYPSQTSRLTVGAEGGGTDFGLLGPSGLITASQSVHGYAAGQVLFGQCPRSNRTYLYEHGAVAPISRVTNLNTLGEIGTNSDPLTWDTFPALNTAMQAFGGFARGSQVSVWGYLTHRESPTINIGADSFTQYFVLTLADLSGYYIINSTGQDATATSFLASTSGVKSAIILPTKEIVMQGTVTFASNVFVGYFVNFPLILGGQRFLQLPYPTPIKANTVYRK
jgi:hypothetical protein